MEFIPHPKILSKIKLHSKAMQIFFFHNTSNYFLCGYEDKYTLQRGIKQPNKKANQTHVFK